MSLLNRVVGLSATLVKEFACSLTGDWLCSSSSHELRAACVQDQENNCCALMARFSLLCHLLHSTTLDQAVNSHLLQVGTPDSQQYCLDQYQPLGEGSCCCSMTRGVQNMQTGFGSEWEGDTAASSVFQEETCTPAQKQHCLTAAMWTPPWPVFAYDQKLHCQRLSPPPPPSQFPAWVLHVGNWEMRNRRAMNTGLCMVPDQTLFLQALAVSMLNPKMLEALHNASQTPGAPRPQLQLVSC